MKKISNSILSIGVFFVIYSKRIKQSLGAMMMLLLSHHAAALQISDFSANWESEASAIVPVVLLIVAAIGIIIAGTAIISGVSAKRNRQPLEWQTWGVIGGGLVTVIPVILLALSGSLTSGEGDADSVMNSLGL